MKEWTEHPISGSLSQGILIAWEQRARSDLNCSEAEMTAVRIVFRMFDTFMSLPVRQRLFNILLDCIRDAAAARETGGI